MNDLISVILPAYNAEKYLAEAIESVLVQTYENFELIMINDGSKDNTLQIMQEYAAKDFRIKIISQENKGLPLTLNVGIDYAQGDIIARMDADDVMLPDRLEYQYDFLKENPEVSMTSCNAYFINAQGKIMSIQKYQGYSSVEEFKQTFAQKHVILCCHSGFITYKKSLLAVGKYNPYPAAEDLDLFTRMAENGDILVIPEKILLKVRIHGSSVTANSKRSLLNQNFTGWVAKSAINRQKGEPLQTYEAYVAEQKSEPWFTRLKIKRAQYAMFYYKRATLDYSNKKYLSFAFNMTRAICYNPSKIFVKAYGIYKNKWGLKHGLPSSDGVIQERSLTKSDSFAEAFLEE